MPRIWLKGASMFVTDEWVSPTLDPSPSYATPGLYGASHSSTTNWGVFASWTATISTDVSRISPRTQREKRPPQPGGIQSIPPFPPPVGLWTQTPQGLERHNLGEGRVTQPPTEEYTAAQHPTLSHPVMAYVDTYVMAVVFHSGGTRSGRRPSGSTWTVDESDPIAWPRNAPIGFGGSPARFSSPGH